MKTRTIHPANFGRYAPAPTDADGYITYHVSPRYARLDETALCEIANSSRYAAVRAAARVELAQRSLDRWLATGEI